MFWALLLSAAYVPPPVQAAAERPPNLIVFVTDDHPHDALSCAGHPVLRTPHIDALAERGIRFTHAFATTPICAASRATLLTGALERRHGYTFQAPPLSAEVTRATYPAQLRFAGYRVGFVGKLGVAIPAPQRAELFDTFFEGVAPYVPRSEAQSGQEPQHLTERNTERALEFLRIEDERPFCLSLWFQAPHAEDDNPAQYVWPKSCDALYADAVIPPPDTSDPTFFAALPEFLRTGMNRKRWHWRFDTEEKRVRMVRGYYRMLSGVDMAIGRIVTELESLGLADNTVILVIGDNGYFLGERGWAGKWTMHERSVRVPLIVYDPRALASDGGRVVAALALNADVAPTLLDFAGIEPSTLNQGRSLRPWLRELTEEDSDARERGWRSEVFTEHLWRHPEIPRTEALRSDDWKYIRYLDHPEYEELYDLRSDPREERNLARLAEHAERLADLSARCSVAAERAR